MINKHEMKLIDQEITDLRNQVFYLNTILNNVTEWLEGERTLTLNPSEIADCDLNDDDVVFGRVECAESLLEQIKKWEGEE